MLGQNDHYASKIAVRHIFKKEHEKLCKMSEDERAAYNATKRVECEKCHKILAHKDKLRRHLESVHNKNKLLKCEHCEHKDSRSDNMKTHMKNNHINLK